MIVNGGDDGDVSRLPSPPFGICGDFVVGLTMEAGKGYTTCSQFFVEGFHKENGSERKKNGSIRSTRNRRQAGAC